MRLIAAISLILLSGCSSQLKTAAAPHSENESERLYQFFERVFEQRLERSPTFKSRLGIKTDYDKWTNQTEAFKRVSFENEQAYLQELQKSFDVEALTPEARLSYLLFEYQVNTRIEQYKWRHHDYPVDHRRGVQAYAASFLINTHTIDSVSEAESYIARLRGIETFFDQIIGQLRIRAAKNIIPPKFVFPLAIQGARNVVTGQPFDDAETDSPLRADFRKKVANLATDSATRERLFEAADAALRSSTGPAYRRLIAYLDLLQQRAKTDDGVWKLPNGDEFYEFELRRRTTTTLTAAEIHDIGLADVERIHDQMRGIAASVDFDGTLQEFFEFMRTDPQFYYPNTDAGREQYLAEATAVIDEMRSRLDSLFTVKPKSDLVVQRVEPFREKSAGKAFYKRPSADGTRPGIYYANLYDTADMPKYQLRALAYHEGIPGHHMQIAIQQELENLPRFRRFGTITAFSEGWGLYSEWLASEIGAYDDPYSDFGRLAMELWRACRLVVDTGIHAKRWTRQQAIDYLLENTPNTERDSVDAIERYIVMPGQATAYKIGMMKIQELRAHAESQLGADFDLRTFHDTVLKNGPIPMAVLESVIEEHIAAGRSGE